MNVHFKNIKQTNKQKGFTLIELGIAIALIAVAAVIVIRTAGSIGSSSKASSETSAMTQLISNAKAFKSGGTYGANTDMVAILIQANQVPGAVTNDGKTLTNQWGGAITVVGNGATLTVNDGGVPRDACLNVVAGVGNGDTTIVVKVGTKVVPQVNGTITASEAASACGTATNDLTFTSTN
jgi:prepilin-type N-terminal cleavage/methylation domain-containing protein